MPYQLSSSYAINSAWNIAAVPQLRQFGGDNLTILTPPSHDLITAMIFDEMQLQLFIMYLNHLSEPPIGAIFPAC